MKKPALLTLAERTAVMPPDSAFGAITREHEGKTLVRSRYYTDERKVATAVVLASTRVGKVARVYRSPDAQLQHGRHCVTVEELTS